MNHVTMKEMLEAGVHFGHQTAKWNPRMKPYVFGARSGIYIIDLQKTVVMAQKAADFVKQVAAHGGKMVFVGTKKQAQDIIKECAQKCGQFYMVDRWLGGTLTNFETIRQNINRLKRLEQMKEKNEFDLYHKKEVLKMEKEMGKLNQILEGIKEMKDLPSAIFVVDLKKEHIAVSEASKLGIPVIGLADTNSDPSLIQFPIPSNDDAIRAIKLFTNMVADAYLAGAEIFEAKLRSMTDKESDVRKEMKAEETKVAKQAPVEEGGPAVVRRVKKRALVTVSKVEELEIAPEESSEEESKE